MNTTLEPVVWISITFILIIATVGCIAALRGWILISEERKGIKKAEIALTADESWEGGYPHDKLKLAVWLRERGIKPDSHLGDFMRTCWSAWLGGRPASLTELHVLVARRERSRSLARISAGIATLLLVCGIVGTLSSIKPVLQDFEFHVTAPPSSKTEDTTPEHEAATTEVAATTERVNELIHDLGNAFWPSLLALAGTIAVVSCRGVYSLTLNRLAMELDGFAVDTLIPRYRVPSLSEQYQEVKASLAGISESILHRESGFHEVVDKLESLVEGIAPALQGLQSAAKASENAVNKLSSGAESITDGLTRSLGLESPLYLAVAGFEGIFVRTENSLKNLSALVEGIDLSNTKSRQQLETAIQNVSQSIVRIAEDHRVNQADAKKSLTELKAELTAIPTVIKANSENAVATGIAAVTTGVELLNRRQKEWHSVSAEQLRKATETGLSEVSQTGKDLATQAGKVMGAVSDIRSIKTEVTSAIQAQTNESKVQIQQIGETAKSSISQTAEALTTQTGRLNDALIELRTLVPEVAASNKVQPDRRTPQSQQIRKEIKPSLPPPAQDISRPRDFGLAPPIGRGTEPGRIPVPNHDSWAGHTVPEEAAQTPVNPNHAEPPVAVPTIEPPARRFWEKIRHPFSGSKS